MKTGDLVWIDGRHLGIFLAEHRGGLFIALSSYDFNVAFWYAENRVFTQKSSEFVIKVVPTCCSDI